MVHEVALIHHGAEPLRHLVVPVGHSALLCDWRLPKHGPNGTQRFLPMVARVELAKSTVLMQSVGNQRGR
jgi:hypothetical protein